MDWGKHAWKPPTAKPPVTQTRIDWENYCKPSSDEDGHQTALFGWFADFLNDHPNQYNQLKRLFSIPNGGLRDKITAGRMRAQGVKRGVPDICLPYRTHKFIGLWVELKRPQTKINKKGRVQTEQEDWHEYLTWQGYCVKVCYGWKEAREIIFKYINEEII